jgi:hypothetical protein
LYACTKYNPHLLCYSKESKLSRIVCCALLKMIASGMSLTWSVTGCMTKEQNNDFHRCRGNQRTSSLFVEENDYSALFYSGANNLLAFWLYLVVRSYFWLNKKVYFFSSCPVKPKDKVSLSNVSIPNERTDNINDALCYLKISVAKWFLTLYVLSFEMLLWDKKTLSSGFTRQLPKKLTFLK